MIVATRDEAKGFSTIPGVNNQILVSGEKQMFMLIELTPSAVIPLHSHMNEQMGVCMKGTVEFQTETGSVVLKENTAYVFASNEKHGCRPLSAGGATLLESFSPPRADYLAIVNK